MSEFECEEHSDTELFDILELIVEDLRSRNREDARVIATELAQ